MSVALLTEIMEVVIIPLLGILTAYTIKWINTKIKNISDERDSAIEKKYLDMLSNTITDCVVATTQTYVDNLKKQGKFDVEAQKMAFNQTYNAVMNILSEEAKEYLTVAVGDLNLYITQKIEAEVKVTKNN